MDFELVLAIIVDVAYSIVSAARLSVMVLSDDRKSMTIFESKDAKAFTISSTTGVAGYVATTGEKVNINDAYNDPRFNPEVDKSTSFTTRSILCVPIVAGGKIVGVIQAVNKTSPNNNVNHFDSDDERGLEALSLCKYFS
jgi:GAF domain-containing protein